MYEISIKDNPRYKAFVLFQNQSHDEWILMQCRMEANGVNIYNVRFQSNRWCGFADKKDAHLMSELYYGKMYDNLLAIRIPHNDYDNLFKKIEEWLDEYATEEHYQFVSGRYQSVSSCSLALCQIVYLHFDNDNDRTAFYLRFK